METRFAFTLPKGYLAPDGKVHREGVLRLATARDEIVVLGDPRVRTNRAYAVVLLLSRVVVRLGDLGDGAVTPDVIEDLFSADLAHLQELYRELNGQGLQGALSCPHCGREVLAEVAGQPEEELRQEGSSRGA